MADIGAPAGDQPRRPVPFRHAWSNLKEPRYRRLVGLWLLISLVVVPSGMLTRMLELTGIPIDVGGVQVHVTIYLPLIASVPLVFWLGYLWAAIPAYLSTFCVALAGGMPLGWTVIFSFANPVGLAIPVLAYRSLPLRTDLRSIASFLYFVIVMFVSSLAGSVGSFVWAHTNKVWLHDFYPIWQGWWLGGFLQSVFICAPILMIAGPAVESWKERRGWVETPPEAPSRAGLMTGILTILTGVAGYTLIVRYFSLLDLGRLLPRVKDLGLREELSNVVDGLSLPHWVMLALAVFTLVFGYRIGMAWAESIRRWDESRAALDAERAVSERLRELDQLKDEFLASTSHELRTPLYGITGLAESLIDGAAGEVPEAVKTNLSMIAGSGRRLGQLVNDILDYSRLTHKHLTLQRQPVDLRPLADVVLTLQQPLVAGRDLELINAVPSDLPAAQADEARVEQILHNLVGNAIKFTEEGRVEIAAAVAGRPRESAEAELAAAGGQAGAVVEGDTGELVITVEDTGIGIAEDQRERIFEAFEQADSGIQRAFGGTGLGLTVTRKLVELHGGRIWVESTVGRGTRFSFSLPVSDEGVQPEAAGQRPVSGLMSVEPSALVAANARVAGTGDPDARVPDAPLPDDSKSPAPMASGGREPEAAHILVVDDEPVILQVLSNNLTSAGYRVTLASNGSEALALAEEQAFDLVVLDVMMPRMSGYEVCRALRERRSLEELPVIFLTAKNQVPDLVAGLRAGGNDYLAKPIGKDELLARIRTHLELLTAHRQLARTAGDLEQRNADLARFNYTVAHDLKNPLTTIKNFLGLARRDAERGETQRLERDLERLQGAAETLDVLLAELFDFSQVGLQANPPEDVPFGELVAAALAALDNRIVQRRAVVEVAPALPSVRGDRARLEELVRHLIDNALRYVDGGTVPRIEIGERTDGGLADGGSLRPGAEEQAILYVRDNGVGIAPQYHEKIFDLFQRLDPGASKGTGIGLALAKRVVEVHGGRIWVESEGAGRGATFCFTLPASPSRACRG